MNRRIEKMAVIGSGIMGGGIAALCAAAGIKTVLLDIVPFDLKDEEKNDPAARNRIVNAGLEGVIKSKPPLIMDKSHDLQFITTGNLDDDLKELADCDWIVEVVVENLKIKQELFKKIEKIRKPGSIISTNTSGLPLNLISEKFSKEMKEHFLGTHFFNPVRYMHLLEIIPGKETSKDIVKFMGMFGEKILGKGIVWAKDTPNFIGNRIGVQSMVYTMQVMMEMGISIPEVDAVFGSPMGRPKTAAFKTADLVGLDTFSHVADNCFELCPKDKMRDMLKLPQFVKDMVEKKWLGNKTNGGFYKKEITPEWKTLRKVIDYKTMEYVDLERPNIPVLNEAKKKEDLPEKMKTIVYGEDKISEFAWKVVAGSLLYSASMIPEISDTVVEIDNAMKWGYNWELGPFETWDAIGLKESVKKMEKDGMKIPANIKKMLENKVKSFYKITKGEKQYYDFKSNSYKNIETSEDIITLANLKAHKKTIFSNPSCSLIDIGDGVFNIEFHSKMNSLNQEIVEMIAKSLDYVADNGVGAVYGNQAPGMPGAFSAGADLNLVLAAAKAKKWTDIDAMIAEGQKLIPTAKYRPFPVVAAPYGLVLGGGCEICLGSDRIVAHHDLFMGLVEIGAGLLPGWGGVSGLWRKFIENRPGVVEISDYGAYYVPAMMNIAQAKVSSSAADARKNGFLGPKDRIVFNKDYLIGEAKKEVLRMVDDGYTPPARSKIPVMGREAMGMVYANMLNMREGGYVTPHMGEIALKIAYVMSGGDVSQGTLIDEEEMMRMERETFVELIKTENSQKMAEHIVTTGKPLFI
jgi:3-hydroxyacyl-CoA dehydrogenase